MISNPLMHDIMKSILKNNANGCFNILREYYGPAYVARSKLFGLDRKIIKSRDEVPLIPTKWSGLPEDAVSYIDVIWELNSSHHIFHEIKSGNFDINDIYEKYRKRELTRKWENHKPIMLADKPLFIWGWKQFIENQNPRSPDLEMRIKYGHLKLFSIELLSPYIKHHLEEILLNL
jgi:hypothetical protein